MSFSPFTQYSKTCDANIRKLMHSAVAFANGSSDDRYLYINSGVRNFPQHPNLPPAVPVDLAKRISKIHSNPSLWWYSQIMKYILRPNRKLQSALEKEHQEMFPGISNYTTSYIGIHIRRTDKVSTKEARRYEDLEYIAKANQHFQLQRPQEKLVYLASDNSSDQESLRQRFTDVSFKGSAKSMGREYCGDGFLGIVVDILMLAKSSYFIGTFSSNVGRLAYELMQALHTEDMSNQAFSLDALWTLVRSRSPSFLATELHRAHGNKEIDLEPGDVITMSYTRSQRASYNYGLNQRTGKQGYYPSFKAERILVTAANLEVNTD